MASNKVWIDIKIGILKLGKIGLLLGGQALVHIYLGCLQVAVQAALRRWSQRPHQTLQNAHELGAL